MCQLTLSKPFVLFEVPCRRFLQLFVFGSLPAAFQIRPVVLLCVTRVLENDDRPQLSKHTRRVHAHKIKSIQINTIQNAANVGCRQFRLRTNHLNCIRALLQVEILGPFYLHR